MARRDRSSLVGQVLDEHYRIDALVGEGGFGVVYKGWDLRFDEPVAIKFLRYPTILTRKQGMPFGSAFKTRGSF
ncbi:MAG: hypothetical protein NZX77_11420 [Polyangiaceae bacterium]|nr:hypothetical protein [Polyangiaceae bacterium]